MASPAQSNRGTPSLASIVTLASWRLRRTWFLLGMTTLGMIAAVVVTCAVPLFTVVTDTAGLRNTLSAQPTSSEMGLEVDTQAASTHLLHDVQQQFDPIFQRNLGTTLRRPTQFLLQSYDFTIASPQLKAKNYALAANATSMSQAAPHIQLLQGRLPHKTSNAGSQIEIMLTPETAQIFGVGVGSTIKLSLGFFPSFPDTTQADFLKAMHMVPVAAHIVGIFTVNDANLAYWHDNNFNPVTQFVGGVKTIVHSLLLPDDAMLGVFDSVSQQYHIDAPFLLSTLFFWYYRVDPSHVSISQLDDLIKHTSAIKTTIDTQYASIEGYGGTFNGQPPYPYLLNVNIYSPMFSETGTPSNLEQYRSRVAVAGIPSAIVSLQILVLILFFVSLMTNLLVDRQSEAIAILRSRGASRGQIFGALFAQSVGLGLLGIVIGLPLTLLVVQFTSQRILPAAVQSSITAATNNPVQALVNVSVYGAAVVLVVLFTMSFSLIRAARMDVLSTRRETARAQRRPLWQRLHLDIAAGAVALLGYCISLYLSTIGTLLSGQAKALTSALFSLISPYFLILVFLFLFLRFFPLLLRLGAWFTIRGRSAASMLALAQMARSPRQSVRMTTLLALTITFALFSLIFFASQEQRVNDLAVYQAGADFSGFLPDRTYYLSPQEQEAQLRAIPGVLSSSAGYVATGSAGNSDVALNMELRGIDLNTFAQTAIWPAQASSQSLPLLLSQLAAKQSYGINNNVVPVIVDETVRSKLALHVGSTFTITVNGGGSPLAPDMHCLVVAMVQHIPTTGNNPQVASSPYDVLTGGVLFDYQTYNTIYKQTVRQLGEGKDELSVNWILLRTKDDATTLAHVRAALHALFVGQLDDRRAIVESLRTDPLTLTLTGILTVGTIATLLLAILGDLLTSWLSARTRLVNFAILRALGTSPRQVASVLSWEQGLIYIIGILLGIAFGVLLATTVVPTLIYYGLSVQISVPVQIVVPFSSIVTLVAVIVVFVLVLGMMVRVVSQPSMSQTLRLNED